MDLGNCIFTKVGTKMKALSIPAVVISIILDSKLESCPRFTSTWYSRVSVRSRKKRSHRRLPKLLVWF